MFRTRALGNRRFRYGLRALRLPESRLERLLRRNAEALLHQADGLL